MSILRQGKVPCGRSSFLSDTIIIPLWVPISLRLSLFLSRSPASGKPIFIAAFAERYIADRIERSYMLSACSISTSRRLEKLSLHGLSTVFDNTEEGNLREDSIGCAVAWWLRNASRGTRKKKKEAPYDRPVKWILYPAETFSKT